MTRCMRISAVVIVVTWVLAAHAVLAMDPDVAGQGSKQPKPAEKPGAKLPKTMHPEQKLQGTFSVETLATDPVLADTYEYFFTQRPGHGEKSIADLDAMLWKVIEEMQHQIVDEVNKETSDRYTCRSKNDSLTFVPKDAAKSRAPRGGKSPGAGEAPAAGSPFAPQTPDYVSISFDLKGGPDLRWLLWELHMNETAADMEIEEVHTRIMYFSPARWGDAELIFRIVRRNLRPLLELAKRVNSERVKLACHNAIGPNIFIPVWMMEFLGRIQDTAAEREVVDVLEGKRLGAGETRLGFWAHDVGPCKDMVRYLGSIRSKAAVPVLMDMVRASSTSRGSDALSALGLIHDDRALPLLLELADHPPASPPCSYTRANVLAALAHYSNRQAVEKFKALAEKDRAGFLGAMRSANPLPDAYFPILENIFQDESKKPSGPSRTVLEAMANTHSARAREIIVSCVAADRPRDAIYELAEFPSADAVSILLPLLLENPDPEWDQVMFWKGRYQAAHEVLAKMPRFAVPRLLELLEKPGDSAFYRARSTLQRTYELSLGNSWEFYETPIDLNGKPYYPDSEYTAGGFPVLRRESAADRPRVIKAWKAWWADHAASFEKNPPTKEK